MAVLTQPALVPPTGRRAAPPAAEFLNVSKTYKTPILGRAVIQALRDVSFRIEPGEVFGLLGPNRAGKTTLVKILLSLCRPSGGTVTRFGRPLHDRTTLAQVGYVHEHQAFPRYLTAGALLEYYGALSFVPYEILRERVRSLLERFGLADRAAEPIGRFSKGMLQRLAMAQALVNDPQLLVLDEPTEGLDLDGRHLLRDVVRGVRDHKGSVLVISHVLGEVQHLCDRVGVLVNGGLVHAGPLAGLYKDPSKPSLRSLEESLLDLYSRNTK
jgi:ABC-2 type transport system ATP-binding protein